MITFLSKDNKSCEKTDYSRNLFIEIFPCIAYDSDKCVAAAKLEDRTAKDKHIEFNIEVI